MDADTRASNRGLVLAATWAVLGIGALLVLLAIDQPLLDGRKVVGLVLVVAGLLGLRRLGVVR